VNTKKRNNVIDILKAGGTRISLFLLFNNILVGAENQAQRCPVFRQNCLSIRTILPLGLRATEGAGLSLSTVKMVGGDIIGCEDSYRKKPQKSFLLGLGGGFISGGWECFLFP
jgi:hypothetical protein